MSTLVQPAYPYVSVRIDTSALVPVAQRNPGVVAVVGNAASGGAAPPDTPIEVSDHGSVMAAFASGVAANALTDALDLALAQDPRPSKVYGVRTGTDDAYAAALSGLDAADDVTFVCLAGESSVGSATSGNTPASGLLALKEHVELMSAAGQRRMGVAMIDPTITRTPTYVQDVLAATAYGPLRSDDGRMILIAARGATGDAAAAAMGAIAGYPPATSVVLKQVRGLAMAVTSQYTPSEITGLAGQGVIPLIDPALIPGTGLYLADGGTFSSDPSRNYVDLTRIDDDIEARLRAGLIGAVGDSRITKAGLTSVRVRIEGILGPLQEAGVIDGYSVTIPLLAILSLPDSARSAAEEAQVVTARQTRQVNVLTTVVVGPNISQFNLVLAPTF